MDLAHTVIVVSAPGAGDDIQAQKAGILEIADVLVVNKADREGADQLVAQLQMMLDLAPAGGAADTWRPPIVRVVASQGTGVDTLLAAGASHAAWLAEGDRMAERLNRRAGRELYELVAHLAADAARTAAETNGQWMQLVADVAARRLDPYAAARTVLSLAGIGGAGR